MKYVSSSLIIIPPRVEARLTPLTMSRHGPPALVCKLIQSGRDKSSLLSRDRFSLEAREAGVWQPRPNSAVIRLNQLDYPKSKPVAPSERTSSRLVRQITRGNIPPPQQQRERPPPSPLTTPPAISHPGSSPPCWNREPGSAIGVQHTLRPCCCVERVCMNARA